jgi:hypothetical protein
MAIVTLKMYMGYDVTLGNREAACLIFAHDTKEAKKIGFAVVNSWFDTDWIDMRVKQLRMEEHLYKEANPEKLAAGIAHVIESPRICQKCEMWGEEINENGVCESCLELIEDEEE